MKDKKIKILSFITLFSVIASVTISASLREISKSKQTPLPNSAVSAVKQEYKYIVREYNGKLAVFEFGENKPFRITDLDVALLPQSDQRVLAGGIRVADNKELIRVLEDYCS